MGQRRRTAKHASPFRLAQQVYDCVEAIHEELLRRRSHEKTPVSLTLSFSCELHVSKRAEARRRFAGSLVSHIAESVEQLLASEDPLRPGRVYCYWCEAADCAHAEPPAARMVFTGYGPTGLPLWEDFVSVCLARGDRRIDRLHSPRPQPFSLFMNEEEIHRTQLAVFGGKSKLFRVRCQAVLGYIPWEDQTGSDRLALTVQAVSIHPPGGRRKLVLNLVGKTQAGADAAAVLATLPEERFVELFQKAHRRMRTLSSQSAAGLGELANVVRHLAAGIEKVCRQGTRRTKHAQVRHRDPSRPAGAALRDTLQAKVEDFFSDKRRRTVVVLGPHGRAHIFNEQGLHVTSLVCRREEIERRIERKLWVPLGAQASEEVRRVIAGAANSDCAAPSRGPT